MTVSVYMSCLKCLQVAMPAMFSWFPGTREHRFLYVHQGWIKVKAEHRGAWESHLLLP